MGYCRPMGYGVHFPAHQVGGRLGLWVKRGYELPEVWINRGSTVSLFLEELMAQHKVINISSKLHVKALIFAIYHLLYLHLVQFFWKKSDFHNADTCLHVHNYSKATFDLL